jgi:hypothetical protein
MRGLCVLESKLFRCCVLLVAALCVPVISGCSGSSAEGNVEQNRASASGKATFKGAPIPAGSVVFLHVDSGTYSNCPISDGSYESESGDGPVHGKNTVNIVGLEGENGKPLWSGVWSHEVTVEGDDFSQDFDVKAEEVKPYKEVRKPDEVNEDAPLYEQ